MSSEFLLDKEIIVASNRGQWYLTETMKRNRINQGCRGIVGHDTPLKETHGTWVSSAIECDHYMNDKYHDKVPVPLKSRILCSIYKI